MKVIFPIFIIFFLFSCQSDERQFCKKKWSLLKQNTHVSDGNDTWIEFLEAHNVKKSKIELENFIECISHDSLKFTNNGISGQYNFTITKNELSFGSKNFEIVELSDSLLTLKDNQTILIYTNKLNKIP